MGEKDTGINIEMYQEERKKQTGKCLGSNGARDTVYTV
jgi:hypothetical protein